MVTARRASAAQRRTAIADAAIALLAEEGSRRLTHRAVDQHLGIPEGSTSAYFRTRASLLAAATQRLAELDRAALEQVMAQVVGSAERASPAELIAAIVNDWTAPAAAPRQLARLELQLEALRSPQLADMFAERLKVFVELARKLVTNAHTAEPVEPDLLAPTLTALVNGLVCDQLLNPHTAVPSQDLPEAIAQLLTGVRNQPL